MGEDDILKNKVGQAARMEKNKVYKGTLNVSACCKGAAETEGI